MSIEQACHTTHAQIVAGWCPWCHEPVRDSAPGPPLWDMDRVQDDLVEGGSETRQATLWNLGYFLLGVEPSLSLLNEALAGDNAELRSDVTTYLALNGDKLGAEMLAWLEEGLPHRLDDLATRVLLLGHYSKGRFQSEEARRKHTALALWTIEHFPASEIAGTPFASPIAVPGSEDHEEGKRLWLLHVESHPTDTRVLGNAASYLTLCDGTKAGELLRRCRSIEPNNPHWTHLIGHLYSAGMIGKDEAAKRDWAAMARTEYEHGQTLYSVEHDRLRALPDLANMAFESGDIAAARKYAEEVLARADAGYEGEPVHYGNQMLGRLALRDGDVERARSHLLESAKTTGSHVLRSFGPSTKLAAELLERGEKEAVLQYLNACYAFWTFELGREWLAKWISQIELGKPMDEEPIHRMFGWR